MFDSEESRFPITNAIDSLESLEKLLNDPSQPVSKDDISALKWTVLNMNMPLFERVLDDPRLNTEHQLLKFLTTLPFSKDNKTEMAALLLDKISLQPIATQTLIYSSLLSNAIIGKALKLMAHLLQDPKYATIMIEISEKKLGHFYYLAIESDYAPPYRRNEMCALLDAHFIFEDKVGLIRDYMKNRQPHYIKPYLTVFMKTEADYLALAQALANNDALEYPDKRQLCAAEFLLYDMEDKIESDAKEGLPLRNFDTAIIKMYDLVNWQYKIACFNTANRIASVETIVSLSAMLKTDRAKQYDAEFKDKFGSGDSSSSTIDFQKRQNDEEVKTFHKELIIHTLHNKDCEHIDADIQQKKLETLLRSLDIISSPYFGIDHYTTNQLTDLLRALPINTKIAFSKEAAKTGNQRLITMLNIPEPVSFSYDASLKKTKSFRSIIELSSTMEESVSIPKAAEQSKNKPTT
jgi:hypothetical protein